MKINVKRIENVLIERGLTKGALAANCGISRQNISTIIRRGTCEPKTAGKLAAGLGVPVAEITGGEEGYSFYGNVCPILGQCKYDRCEWWCTRARKCSVPFIADLLEQQVSVVPCTDDVEATGRGID